jgi:hypothetical protein
MFGFGKSQLEKVLLGRAIETLKPFGLESEAQSVLDQAKQAALSLTSNLESVNFGDSIIRNTDYVRVREAEGLSKEEVRDYWNRGGVYSLPRQHYSGAISVPQCKCGGDGRQGSS